MAGRGAHHQAAAAEDDDIVGHQKAVGAERAARRRNHDPAAGALLQQPGAGHVIGVDMGFEGRDQRQTQLADQRHVAPDLLEHRVDQHRLAARPITQQIGVGRGLRVEQLTEHQHFSPPAAERARRSALGAYQTDDMLQFAARGGKRIGVLNIGCRAGRGDPVW